jgi:hypothetical protein
VTWQAGRAAARERRRTRAWPKTCLAVDLNRHSPLAMSRERPGTHAWPKPCLARGQQPQRTAHDVTRRHPDFHVGEALFGGTDLHTHASLATSRDRSRTHAWPKPCLAGRPTALVRTQSPEQNTSRGRRSGMELPDYPVVATLPTPWDQDGPALPLPTGSFFKFVARSASRRLFSSNS